MLYKDIEDLKEETFKRLVGVKKSTFLQMVFEAQRLEAPSKHKIAGSKRGPKPKLSYENKLLMLLMYYREYRTFLHIATTFGVSETQCWRIITDLERLLIKSKLFHIAGNKKLLSENVFEVIVIDVAETPIERPKKNKGNIIQARKKDIP